MWPVVRRLQCQRKDDLILKLNLTKIMRFPENKKRMLNMETGKLKSEQKSLWLFHEDDLTLMHCDNVQCRMIMNSPKFLCS